MANIMLICKRKCRPNISRHCAAEAQRLNSGADIGRTVLKAADKPQTVGKPAKSAQPALKNTKKPRNFSRGFLLAGIMSLA